MLVVAPPGVVAVAVAAALADVAAAASAGSLTCKARGECWAQRVSKLLTMAEVVAGDDYEIAWSGTMSCVSERTVAVDSGRGSFAARFGKTAVKMAGESLIAIVAILLIGVVILTRNAGFDLEEARRTSSV